MREKPIHVVPSERAALLAERSNKLILELQKDLIPIEVFMVLANCAAASFLAISQDKTPFIYEMAKTFDYHVRHKNPGLVTVIEREVKK